MVSSEGLLSIGEFAEQTGVSVATLRAWESRHGFPVAVRLPSGHRRYRQEDVEQVRAVARRRDAGLRLDAAVAELRHQAAPSNGSVFATLRRDHPHLPVERLRKSTLTALSWAIEDEFCAKADRARIFGAFQRQEHYWPSQARWEELARFAAAAYVFADFDEDREVPGTPGVVSRVPVDAQSPLRREWAVVCDSDDLPVALTAWELPGQQETADPDRLFEAIWTIEPQSVRDAARVCAGFVATADPAVGGPLLYALADDPARSTPDLASLNTMFTRVLAYVDRR